jgi:outer membrane receptor protein involved in Fe transport
MFACFKSILCRLLLSAVLSLITLCSFGQNSAIIGKIVDSNNSPLPYINIHIKQLGQGTVADEAGEFKIEKLSHGTYELTISGIGFETKIVKATVPGSKLNITLEDSREQLEEVTVVGKSETQLAKEQSIRAEVINTKLLATQPATMIELMNRSAGVRIRQTGGLGSTASLMVNGFQDRAIKYFKDGVPMDYLGAGFNFALVPVNMLDRIEIYKGVLPTSLGADALGGGINMVTKKSFNRHAEASYEVASFNTHRASLNLFYKDTARHFFIGGDAFFNHSDNNYEVTVAVTDPELGNQKDDKVRLFHNKFTHYYAEIYGGIIDTKWADELRIGLIGFQLDRENQYGSRMTQPFGASTSTQYSLVPTLRYKKSFFDGRLQFDQFLVANTIHVEQVDTAKGTYDWYGRFYPSNGRRGEVSTRGSLSDVGFSYFTSRSNFTYDLNSYNRLELNVVYTKLSRKGSDPLGLTFATSGRDILSVPAYYNKVVTAAGLETKFLDGRLVNNLIGKYYHAETLATDGDYYGNELDRDATNERWGVAEAVKFQLNQASLMRFSAEVATRLPEQDEIFGDGNLHVSNFELKPERSINANLGYRTEKYNRYSLELNTFYRITKDLILNVPYNFLYNQHQNVDQVKGIGFETDATASILKWLKINGNFTYQDFRLFDTGNSSKEGARLRNTPYFYANLGVTALRSSLLSDQDKLQMYWYLGFVREYYRDYIPKDREPDGFLGLWGKAQFDAPNIIPNQTTHTAGVTYFPKGDGLSIAVQCKNIFDADVYDNFRIQNAGRSFHLKLTYILN